MGNITLSVTTAPDSLTVSGVKSLGAPADIVATAIPGTGAPVLLGTLPAQSDGPYTISAAVPPGSYTVQVTTSTTLSSDTKSSATVPMATLTATGNNTLGFPANIVVTATPSGGGSPIAIATLTNEPVGPYSVTANVPPGDYELATEMNVTLTSDATSSSTVLPPTLTASGNNTLGFPANIVVTATPAGGGSSIIVGTLTNQPVGPYLVTAAVPPGTYTLDTAMSATLTGDATSSSTVLPATLTAIGNNTLGSPANVVVTATPTAGGSPIAIATLVNQTVGPFSVTAPVPAGNYTVDIAMTATLASDATSSSIVLPATLTAIGNNTLGTPANVVVTATATAGGSPITIATLVNQPVGPFSVTAPVPAGDYTVDMAMSATLTSDATSASSVAPTTLTWTGNNTLGVAANIVVTATPTGGGSPINIATLTNQPAGPCSVTAVVPPGAYTVDAALSATLSSDATSLSTVAPTTLTWAGNNTLGVAANIVVTATPAGGGSPINIATLTNQPVGPCSVTAVVPPGVYMVDAAMSATLTSDATSLATVALTTLTSTGTNTLGFPANIVVTATPSGGGSPITIATLTNEPVGPFSVTAAVPPGNYSVDTEMCVTLSYPTGVPVSVPQTTLNVTGVKSLGVPADLVAVAAPVGSGSPIPLGTLPAQPDGPYAFTSIVPPGTYAIDVSSSIALSAAASCSATVPAPTLTAVITYNGNTYSYNESGGTALGNYTDPQGRFTMTNTMATNAGLPNFTVFFRRNTDGTCEHTVFEYGNPRVTVQPINLNAYTATISKAGVVLHTENVPNHFWFARWRWPQSPYPVTVTPAALIASGLLPHYDASVLGKYGKAYAAYTYTPMTLAGLCGDMGQTGERGDIGLVTEWQADYICCGTNLPTVLAQAEAGGTFPWIMRDPTTGAPFNAQANPSATTQFVNKSLPATILTTTCNVAASGARVYCDEAHEPELAYLPFLLTGDPYHLESMQFQGTANVVMSTAAARYNSSLGVRAVAWGLRTAGRLSVITPVTVPSWLLPKSVWAADVASRLAWLHLSVISSAMPCTVFQVVQQTQTTYCDFWEGDFVTATLCDLVRLGLSSCQTALSWVIQQAIARTNGTSGWLRCQPSPYNVNLMATASSPMPTSWAGLWALNYSMQPANLPFSPSDATGNACLALNTSGAITYPSYARAVLAMAARLGIAGTAAPFAWIDGEITRQLSATLQPDRKWMIT